MLSRRSFLTLATATVAAPAPAQQMQPYTPCPICQSQDLHLQGHAVTGHAMDNTDGLLITRVQRSLAWLRCNNCSSVRMVIVQTPPG